MTTPLFSAEVGKFCNVGPPFNPRQDYNVLFAEKDGSQSSSQIHAFADTCESNSEA